MNMQSTFVVSGRKRDNVLFALLGEETAVLANQYALDGADTV